MAKAGWHFAPSAESPDSVECIYCKVALDGWEPKDDPIKEHERRAKDLNCAFFNGFVKNGTVDSIFAMAKSAFAVERARNPGDETESLNASSSLSTTTKRKGRKAMEVDGVLEQEPVAEKKKVAKRKLPVSKAKKAALIISEVSDDESLSQVPIPINLQSARKKRTSDKLSEPDEEIAQVSPEAIKKPRLARLRSSRVSNAVDYVDVDLSPEVQRTNGPSSRGRSKRSRTPLEEISESFIRTNNTGGIDLDDPIAEVLEEARTLGLQPESLDSKSVIDSQLYKENLEPQRRGKHRASSVRNTTSTTQREHVLDIDVDDIPGDSSPNPLPISSGLEQNSRPLPIVEGIATVPLDLEDDSTTDTMAELGHVQESLMKPKKKVGAVVSSAEVSRPLSSRRGSKTILSHNLEEVVQIIPRSRRSTSRASARQNVSSVATREIEVLHARGSTSNKEPTRRSSSRRRGSGASAASNIEDIIMLDHKARPRPQQTSHKMSAPMRLLSSQDDAVLLEEEEEEHDETPLPKDIGHSLSDLQPLQLVAEDLEEEKMPHRLSESKTLPLPIIDLLPANTTSEMGTEVQSLSSSFEVVYEPNKETNSSQNLPALRSESVMASDAAALEAFASPTSYSLSLPNNTNLNNLTAEEKEMTLEEWLRSRNIQEARKLVSECESMIEGLQESGRQARAAICAA